MEKKQRIFIVAENEEEEKEIKAFKMKCIELNLLQKEALIKLFKQFTAQN